MAAVVPRKARRTCRKRPGLLGAYAGGFCQARRQRWLHHERRIDRRWSSGPGATWRSSSRCPPLQSHPEKRALSCHRTRRDSRSWPSDLGQNPGGAERRVAGCYGGQTRRVRNRRVGNASPRGWRDDHLDPQVRRRLAVRGPRMRAFPPGRPGRDELAKDTQIARARALSTASIL